MKKLSVFILAMTLLIGMIAPLGVNAAGVCGDLPATLTVNFAQPWTTAYFETTISGDGFLNGTYDGWCIDLENSGVVGQNFDAKVICTYDPEAAGYVNFPQNLDLVNWILNQDFRGKTAPDGTYNWRDVQMAIWRLLEDPTFDDWGASPWTEANVSSIIASAQASGEGFTPGSGDLCAIILVPMNEAGQIVSQISIIALPRRGGEGCTPGFWKNNADKWGAVAWEGYTPGQTLESVFDVPDSLGLDSKTLLQALEFKGGKGVQGAAQILLRAGVAALLNAANPNIDYAKSASEIIADVNGALASGDRAEMLTLAGELDGFNNAGASIDMHGNPL